MLLQTRHFLLRPYCILEVLTAIEADVPIVAVNIYGQGYNFEEAEDFLLHFDEKIDERSPDARRLLAEHAGLVTRVARALASFAHASQRLARPLLRHQSHLLSHRRCPLLHTGMDTRTSRRPERYCMRWFPRCSRCRSTLPPPTASLPQ